MAACGHNTENVYNDTYTGTSMICGSLMVVYANQNMLEQLL
jgi:hypothetical protein